MSNKTTVAVIGATIWGNRGAEAMLVTSIGQVREMHPDTQFVIFSYLPKRDRSLINDKAIRVYDARPLALVLKYFPAAMLCWLFALIRIRLPDFVLPKAIRDLRQSDMLLDISGISFADKRIKFLPFNILNIWPAFLLRVPVVKLAQAVGPFNNPLNRWCSRLFLARCHHIYARGKATAAHLTQLGLAQAKWTLAPDIAFLYKQEYSLSDENDDLVNQLLEELTALRSKDRMIIGLVPSSLVYQQMGKLGRDYVLQFLKLIRDLDTDYHYVVLPNATREGSTKTRNNDLAVIDLLEMRAERELPAEAIQRLHFVNYDINTASSRKIIEDCDLIVTSRFHGMISGLCLRVPVVVIGWSHKYKEILDEFDMGHLALDFANPELDASQLAYDAIENRLQLGKQITDNLPSVRTAAEQQFVNLQSLLH
jgi:colanic acid/amylovoran biosynthesis protein